MMERWLLKLMQVGVVLTLSFLVTLFFYRPYKPAKSEESSTLYFDSVSPNEVGWILTCQLKSSSVPPQLRNLQTEGLTSTNLRTLLDTPAVQWTCFMQRIN